MPTCPSCGKAFTGISFGSEVADVCRDCRVVRRRENEARIKASGSPLLMSLLEKPKVTYSILILNILVYLAMGVSGASWTEPSTLDAIKWGGDFGPLTLSHDCWRIVTSMFVHFGIIHIGFNMYCFWDLGRGLEPLMGRRAFLLAYAVSGIAASIVSLYWDPWRVSAGASGAIFGIAGAFLSYLYFRKTQVNQAWLKRRVRSLVIFIVYNLFYGLRPGVDNSAHIGGLIAGLILGLLIPPRVFAPSPEAAGKQAGTNPMVSPVESQTQVDEHLQRLLWIGTISSVILVGAFVQLRLSHKGMIAYGDAVQLEKSGQMPAAISMMESATMLDPNMPLAQDWAGEAKLMLGDAAGAIPHFQKLLEIYPHDSDANYNLALAYLGSGDPTKALEQLGESGGEPYLQAGKDFIAGVAGLQTNDLRTARQFLPNAAEKNKSLWQAQAALGQLRADEGNLDAARSIYSEILKNDPQNVVAKENLEVVTGAGSKKESGVLPLKVFDIPYAELVSRSDAWPYYP